MTQSPSATVGSVSCLTVGREALDQPEQAFSPRWYVGTVLNVIGRPEAFSLGVIPAVKQGGPCRWLGAEDDLAECLARFDGTVSVGRLVQRELAVDDRLHLPVGGEGDQLLHRLADQWMRPDSLDTGALAHQGPQVERDHRIADRSGCDKRPLLAECLDAVGERFGADRIEDDVRPYLPDLRVTVANCLSSQSAYRVEPLAGRRRIHVRPERPADINRRLSGRGRG